ncbi:MAG TPA: hypothetical protein VH391_06405 [Solirubrobacterales bacterium]
MASTPSQRIWQDRVEALVGLAAPVLDVVLSAGERVSRLLAPEDRDYYPIRPPGEAFELDSARRHRSEPVD